MAEEEAQRDGGATLGWFAADGSVQQNSEKGVQQNDVWRNERKKLLSLPSDCQIDDQASSINDVFNVLKHMYI